MDSTQLYDIFFSTGPKHRIVFIFVDGKDFAIAVYVNHVLIRDDIMTMLMGRNMAPSRKIQFAFEDVVTYLRLNRTDIINPRCDGSRHTILIRFSGGKDFAIAAHANMIRGLKYTMTMLMDFIYWAACQRAAAGSSRGQRVALVHDGGPGRGGWELSRSGAVAGLSGCPRYMPPTGVESSRMNRKKGDKGFENSRPYKLTHQVICINNINFQRKSVWMHGSRPASQLTEEVSWNAISIMSMGYTNLCVDICASFSLWTSDHSSRREKGTPQTFIRELPCQHPLMS
ncbi:hypothetical protein NN561_014804 [Cricetulus griseus]